MDYIPTNNPTPSGEPYGVNPQINGNNTAYHTPTPAEIYNATAPNGTPNYHYGAPHNFFNPQYIEEQRKKLLERRKHEKTLKGMGTNTGITLLILLGISVLLSYLLILPTFSTLYETNLTFSSAFAVFYSIISVGGAFFIGSKLFKRSKTLGVIPFNAPKDKTKALLLVLMGFGGCLVANYITVFLRTFAEGMGIYSSYSALEDPSSTLDIVMIFLCSSVIPPLVEEFAMRGVLMQSMRKYGNTFAIIASALMFGIFHGNAVQMPFAFLCGLVIGYAVVATESLWVGVIIHALMNSMSSISSALIYYFDEYTSNTFFYVGSAVGIVAGILALIIYFTRYKDDDALKVNGEFSDASPIEKVLKFISSPVLVIAIVIFFIEAISQLSLTPPAN